jgi:hypothetical protein
MPIYREFGAAELKNNKSKDFLKDPAWATRSFPHVTTILSWPPRISRPFHPPRTKFHFRLCAHRVVVAAVMDVQ